MKKVNGAKNNKQDNTNGLCKTTIQMEIRKRVTKLVAISLAVVGTISSFLNYYSTRDTLKRTMTEQAETAAEEIGYIMQTNITRMEIIGSIARLSNPEVAPEQKQELLEGYRSYYDWISIMVTDENGVDRVGSGTDVSGSSYFSKVMNGESVICDPVKSQDGSGMAITLATPLMKDGKLSTYPVGAVVVEVDAKILTDIVGNIRVSNNGSAYIINAEADTIAHDDYNLVLNGSNTVKEAQTNSSLKSLAKLEQKMVNGNTGFGQYSDKGSVRFLAYAPIPINGWSLGVTAPIMDFMTESIIGIAVIVILLVISVYIAKETAKRMGISLGEPINKCADRLRLLADGDLETPLPAIKTENETMILAESTRIIVERMNQIIGDMAYLLEEMAGGNFAVKSKIGEAAYVGAFRDLLMSIRTLNGDLRTTLREIHEASKQVEAGASQMAESAQSLAEGATDQAGSVEELLATVSEVAGHVAENTKATDNAHERTNDVAKEAKISQDKMHDLTAAMDRIEETSNEISNIIENIEDIASQTNLLSLNAAIEAARAGEAGKGFAVVADQIRKLAEQSAQSAIDTRKLIEAAISEVDNGGVITKDTAEYLDRVMEGLDEILSAVGDVRQASDRQAAAMQEIEIGVSQISSVVENNSAAAQETSATSEELSAQSESLNALVDQFKLD